MDNEKITFCDWDLSKIVYDEEKDKHYFLMEVDGKKESERLYVKKEKDNNQFYYIEKGKKRVENEFGRGSYVEVEKRIHVLPVEKFQPDWEMYNQRIGERAEILIGPLIGREDARLLIENVLNTESKPMFDWIKNRFKPKKGTLL